MSLPNYRNKAITLDPEQFVSKVTNRQTIFFTKVIGTTLRVFGTISAIAQLVMLFLESEGRFTTFLALVFSLGLVWLGRNKVLKQLVQRAQDRRTGTKVGIFFAPIVLLTIFVLLRVFLGLESWKDMNTEGGFIEYGTSLAFLLAAVFAFPIGKYFLAKANKFLGYFYYLISLGFFLVGMEEISWGQRLLGIESSEFFQTYNSQEEITLHNLIWVNEYLDKTLMFVALIGGISWLTYSLISNYKHNHLVKYVIPRWFLSSFFLIVFIFFYLIEYVQTWNGAIANFQESIELIFSLGCFSFILTNFFATAQFNSKLTRIGNR